MTDSFLDIFHRPIVFQEVQRYVWPPSWLEHTPFAFWLMDELRPNLVVELGTHSGNSFSAFCQAAKFISYSPKCYAIDTWEGDPHAGLYDEKIFQDISNYVATNFGALAKLVRSTFNDALQQFSDGSIDLLNIDGYHTYEATKENFETWLPKLSKRGVVLIHDTSVHTGDFGAWKFWDEIKDKYPSFAFIHGHGLALAVTGSEISPGLRWLTSKERSNGELERVRQLFSTIGMIPSLRCLNDNITWRYNELDLESRTKQESLNSQIADLARYRSLAQENLGPTFESASDRVAELSKASDEVMKWRELALTFNDNFEISSAARKLAALSDERCSLQSQLRESIAIQAEQSKLLNSTGHRLVSKVDKLLRKTSLGRFARGLFSKTLEKLVPQ